MYLGHFAVGFGAKSAAPRTSLGTLFLAAQFVDLLWPTFLLLGLESVRVAPGITAVTPLDFEHYPISHSFVAALGWAIAFAATYAISRRYLAGTLVVGFAVASHWFLDVLTHRPDLPLAPGSDTVFGLGLWNDLPATVVVELALLGAGVALYVRSTCPADGAGTWGLWGLVGFLLLTYAGNLFGPPPPSAEVIAWVGQAQWILVVWAYWLDRHRAPRVFLMRTR
jgi:hypothetical protein